MPKSICEASDASGVPGLTRVLCLTSWYPPHHYGGYEAACFDVMTRLATRGHHVEVLCSDEQLPGVAATSDPHERSVQRRLRLYYRDGDIWSPGLRERVAIERHNHAVLAEVLESCQPDVVAVWHLGALSLGLITDLAERRIPVVYCIQDLWPNYAVALDPWLRLFARSRLLGRVTHRLSGLPATVPDLDVTGGFCFISHHTRARARQGSRWRFPTSAVVFSGIDHHLFRPPAADDRSRWGGRLLYAGRLDPRKGVDTLLEAVALLPETTLAVVGRGSEADQARLGALAERLGIASRVTWSHAERSELAAVYGAADLCVFPSEWEEPFGLVPLEAMACATPVVATATGGSGEFLVDGYNCVVFEAGNANALAAAVTRVAAQADLRAQLVAAGLDTADFFDVERLADEFEAWHADAAAGFPAGPRPDRQPPSTASVPPKS